MARKLDASKTLLVLTLFMMLSLTICGAASRDASFRELKEVSNLLNKYNKPAVKTIKSPDGDIIDCVLMHQQPAFDHPLLKNHVIQMTPSVLPMGLSQKNNGSVYTTQQLWNQNDRCPAGTIPIRRITAADLTRSRHITRFGMKDPSSLPINKDAAPAVDYSKHEHAYGSLSANPPYYGTQCTINLWAPFTEHPQDFSLAQFWIFGSSPSSNTFNTIEAGWQVYNSVYGDNNPRLFIFWTTDSYQTTGCYNLMCSGFVQTNNDIVLGGTVLSPVSTYAGQQFEITIMFWKDPNTGNWWLRYQGTDVGYYPSSMFDHLNSYSTQIEWGGEVYISETDSSHTTTQMGSGHFPSEGYTKAAYFRNILTVDSSNTLVQPSQINVAAEKPNCYYSTSGTSSDMGAYMFFGGPGRNANCP